MLFFFGLNKVKIFILMRQFLAAETPQEIRDQRDQLHYSVIMWLPVAFNLIRIKEFFPKHSSEKRHSSFLHALEAAKVPIQKLYNLHQRVTCLIMVFVIVTCFIMDFVITFRYIDTERLVGWDNWVAYFLPLEKSGPHYMWKI